MIHFILVQNRQGKTRLEKWYTAAYTHADRTAVKTLVHRTIVPRDARSQSNFLPLHHPSPAGQPSAQPLKLVYRRYAGLFFCFAVDASSNELATLESIHLFVEVLDAFFGNVCELDLVFNYWRVYGILDEVVLGGEVQESSKAVILTRLDHIDKLA